MIRQSELLLCAFYSWYSWYSSIQPNGIHTKEVLVRVDTVYLLHAIPSAELFYSPWVDLASLQRERENMNLQCFADN